MGQVLKEEDKEIRSRLYNSATAESQSRAECISSPPAFIANLNRRIVYAVRSLPTSGSIIPDIVRRHTGIYIYNVPVYIYIYIYIFDNSRHRPTTYGRHTAVTARV